MLHANYTLLKKEIKSILEIPWEGIEKYKIDIQEKKQCSF